MIAEAIEYLVKLGRKETLEVEGKTYVPSGYSVHSRPRRPALGLSTLDALILYLEDDVEGAVEDAPFLHVVSPTQVNLLFPWKEDERVTVCSAHYDPPDSSVYGGWTPVEDASIQLQACTEDVADLPDVLRIIGNVKNEAVKTQADDGVTQTVTARMGVVVGDAVQVPRVVRLAPFRTFPEVDQPISTFVLRLRNGREGIEAALFEADNSSWRLEAIRNVEAYLGGRLSGFTILA